MLLGILKYDPETAKTLAGIEWKKLNDKHKHDYAAGITQVLLGLQGQGRDASKIQTEVETVYAQVQKLTLARLPSSDRPPK